MALEVRPGVLLRVTRATGDKHFAHAAQTLDAVSAAGHLVSIAVADGIANTPTALLANHMESSLAAAVAMEGKQGTGIVHVLCACVFHVLCACVSRFIEVQPCAVCVCLQIH